MEEAQHTLTFTRRLNSNSFTCKFNMSTGEIISAAQLMSSNRSRRETKATVVISGPGTLLNSQRVSLLMVGSRNSRISNVRFNILKSSDEGVPPFSTHTHTHAIRIRNIIKQNLSFKEKQQTKTKKSQIPILHA